MTPSVRATWATLYQGSRALGLMALMLFGLAWPGAMQAAILPANFAETLRATGLDATGMEIAPDGRVFITEKGGRVRIIKNGALLPSAFLTVTVDIDLERGLQQIVFDPAFATNNYVYIYYTVPGSATAAVHNRVSRFTAAGDVAVPGSELILLELSGLVATNHNGGGMAFLNGKLMIATGDNALPSNSQTLANTLGKVLRINTDGTIPIDNPFYTSTQGQSRAIYALGLRNPFKIAAQPGTGKIYVNDVGEITYEEINELAPGKNYGWPTVEGYRTTQTVPTNYQDPIYVYDHINSCSITGGAFYNPTPGTVASVQFPTQYTGKYFFTDYCGGYIKTFDPATGLASPFATGLSEAIHIRVGIDGTLWYVQRGNGGQVNQIRYTASTAPTLASQPASISVSVGQPASFSVQASGLGLSYQWQRNQVNIAGAAAPTYTLPTTTAADDGASFRVIVSNTSGSVASSAAMLTVLANQPPTAKINAPLTGTLYRAGTIIQFAGTGTDPEQGTALPASAYNWRVLFLHDAHNHPGPALTVGADGKSGYFTIPSSGETAVNVSYRLYLTVTDNQGAKKTDSVSLLPRTAIVTISSNPQRLRVVLNGVARLTPFSQPLVSGMLIGLSPVSPQVLGDSTYNFFNWALGAPDNTGNIIVPDANKLYLANFRAVRPITPPPPPAPTNVIVSGGTYQIQGKASGKYLTVAGSSKANGALLQLQPLAPNTSPGTLGGISAASQLWVVRLANGYYTLQSVNSGRYIDMQGPTRSDGGLAQQWDKNNQQNQDFLLPQSTSSAGFYGIVSRYSAKGLQPVALSTADGTNLEQRTVSNTDAQLYRFVRVGTSIARQSVEEAAAAPAFLVYPNPASGQCTVAAPEGATLTLTDGLGRQALTTPATPRGQTMLDVQHLAPGLYILRISGTGKEQVQRVMITR